MIRISAALLLGGLVLSAPALAQQPGTYKARLVADARNISYCFDYNAALGREQSITVAPSGVTLESAGGVKGKLEMVKPSVYQTDRIQSGVHQLLIVADFSATPNMLILTEKQLGCRWHGELAK